MNDLNISISDIAVINEFSSDSEDFKFTHADRKWSGFVYFTEGEGNFCILGGESFKIKKSSLVLLKAGDSYSFSIKAGYRYIASAYRILDNDNSLALLPKVLECSESENLLVSKIYKSWQQRKNYSLLSCKIDILTLYLELFKKHLPQRYTDPVINSATDFINSNFKRCFSSRELADFCKISESYLRFKFKEALGVTITEYREQARIEEAKRMLSSLIFTPKEIAYELGYSDVYHFTKVFKQKTGIPPAKYARFEKTKK
ncbi:MAG: helix-turn-helix transcriptional regulator [Ruminococcaceae bacterium]|nr:helix-turn-helix transcriptional regulator [Oscillospiraceae bacterium]